MAALVVLSILCVVQPVLAFTVSETDLGLRRNLVLARAISHPNPNPDCTMAPEKGYGCLWGKLSYGLAALYLARNDNELRAGNEVISEAIAIISGGMESNEVLPRARRARMIDQFRFLTSGFVMRIYFLFGANSEFFPGRLDSGNEHEIERIFWVFAKTECRVADAADPWRIRGSENISLMWDTTCWAAAEILARSAICGDCIHDDRSTPSEQLAAWAAFLIQSVRERAKYGIIEFYSPTYYKYTLQSFYSLADFSSDPKLRRLASALLDVWWAGWAQEQINGLHGGSKSRAPGTRPGLTIVGSQLAWLYFGFDGGIAATEWARGTVGVPALMIMVASRYRPAAIVGTIASAAQSSGPFASMSRQPGLLAAGSIKKRAYVKEIDAASGGVLRYTFASPSFVMGTAAVAKLELTRWVPFGRQNVWSGLVLDRNKHVSAWPLPSDPRSGVFNDVWGVQSRATQIVQKLPAPFSSNAGKMAIWFGQDLEPERQGDWIFINDRAFIAVRPAFGGMTEDSSNPRRVILNDETSPVIVQAAEKADFADYEAFKSAVLAAPLTVSPTNICFGGLGGAGVVCIYLSDQLPTVDGVPIDVRPAFLFRSPYLNSDWGSAVVTIGTGADQIVHDFR